MRRVDVRDAGRRSTIEDLRLSSLRIADFACGFCSPNRCRASRRWQIGTQIGGVLVTLVSILVEGFVDDFFQRWRESRD